MKKITQHLNTAKGFTLIEMLVVISIIATLFVFLMPQINASYIKSQESGVKTDFRTFQLAMESYMMESKGKSIKLKPFNDHLDNAHLVELVGTKMQTNSSDPWGTPYEVEFGNRKIVFTSYGKDEKDDLENYTVATYYHEGIIDTCTSGFDTGNMKLASIKDIPIGFTCGDNLATSMPSPEESLPTPKNFVASNVTHNNATLSWSSVSGATSYVLKRNGTTVYTGNTTSYNDVDLVTGTDNNYTLVAKNATSISSAAVLKVTTPLVAPSAPTHLVASNVTDTSLVLNWNMVPGATSYKLARNGVVIYTGKTGVFADSGLTFNKKYTYSLTAINNAGESSPYSISVTTKLMEIGTGIPTNPYIIYNVDQLQRVDFCLTCHFELGNDIDSSKATSWNNGAGFEPIRSKTTESYFSGQLDGKNYTIHNMSINRPAEDWVAIFDYLDTNGVLKNIKIEDTMIIGKDQVGLLVGGIAKGAKLTNIQVDGDVMGGLYVGGIAGYSEGEISNVSSASKVTGDDKVGGIVADNFGIVTNSSFDGEASATLHSVGGLVGYNNGTVSYSDSRGTINGAMYIGGIVGFNDNVLSDSTSSATINGSESEIGGIVGRNHEGTVNRVISTAIVNGDSNTIDVGGVVGYNNSSILNATSTAIVNGYQGIGGISGANDGSVQTVDFNGSIENVHSDGGGIIGSNFGTLTDAISTGSILGTDDEIGGVAGSNFGIIEDAQFTGNVIGQNNVGGLVGFNQIGSQLNDSTTDSSVSGVEFIGGATGRNSGTITGLTVKSIAEASDSDVGGLTGINEGEIYDSVVTANVNSDNQVGGVAGDNNGLIDGVTFDGSATGHSSVAGIVGTNEGELYNSTAKADVFGFTYIAGGIGYNHSTGYAENVDTLVDSNIEGTEHIGGVIGHNIGDASGLSSKATVVGYEIVGGIFGFTEGLVSDLDSNGFVEGERTVGGIAGTNSHIIADAHSYADVVGVFQVGGIAGSNYMIVEHSSSQGSIQGDSRVGGLVGENLMEVRNSNSFATIDGRTNVGGLVGKSGHKVLNSYSTGTVTGSTDVGGLVGDNTGSVTHSYSVGKVVGTSTYGGLVGLNGTSATVTNSYYNSSTSGQSDTGKGAGRTTAQLKTQSTYVGWNFTNVWVLNPSVNSGYPNLR